MESLFDDMDFSSNVTRARFDNQMSNFTSDLLAPLSTLLTSAGPTTADIGKVVIVGGTSKIVKLQTVLASKFPNAEIMSSFAPDEVIALGAAVQASYINHETTQESQEKLMSVSRDIIAVLEGADCDIVVFSQDSTIPCKRSIPIPVTEDRDSLYYA